MPENETKNLAVWFPTVRTGTGTDSFTIRLVDALNKRGIKAEITWLPLRSEFAPWTVTQPRPPKWAKIVHINSWLHRRFIPSDLPLIVTLHSCVHDAAFLPYKSLAQKYYHQFWIKACEAYAISRANIVTAVSHYTAEQARSIFKRGDIITIHNWVDLEYFIPSQKQTSHQPFRLLFVGKPSKRKGSDLLPKIMRRLGIDFELHYTGIPEQLGNVSDGIPNNMIALGKLDEENVIKAYQNCDALLFPTRLEGFGLVVAEAQACGKPVITSLNSALPEVVVQNKTGILCPTDDIQAFVNAIRNISQSHEKWKAFSHNARQYCLEQFSEEKAIKSYISIYQKLFSSSLL